MEKKKRSFKGRIVHGEEGMISLKEMTDALGIPQRMGRFMLTHWISMPGGAQILSTRAWRSFPSADFAIFLYFVQNETYLRMLRYNIKGRKKDGEKGD